MRSRLRTIYYHYRKNGEPMGSIPLDPGQVKAIDALAEALGIPHKRGTTEIPIPEKIRMPSREYSKWDMEAAEEAARRQKNSNGKMVIP